MKKCPKSGYDVTESDVHQAFIECVFCVLECGLFIARYMTSSREVTQDD